MPTTLVATRNGLRSFDDEGGAGQIDHAGRSVTAVARDGSELWTIVDGSEIWHAAGADWEHVADLPGIRGTCIAMTDAIHVGSSEARLFRLGAGRLEPVEAFDRAEGRSAWYTPWGGPPDTRSISEWRADVFVNVHVGGILRTEDAGETWTPTIDVDADVHQVATAEGLVLAACAGGLGVSTDRGSTWAFRTDGLEARYSRAVTVCGDAVLVSASNGPGAGRSAVYRASRAGGVFERCRTGLPEWFDDNVDSYCLDALPDGSFAAFGTSDGHVYASTNAGAAWDELTSGLPAVQHVLVVP
jgi:hypothetical protein